MPTRAAVLLANTTLVTVGHVSYTAWETGYVSGGKSKRQANRWKKPSFLHPYHDQRALPLMLLYQQHSDLVKLHLVWQDQLDAWFDWYQPQHTSCFFISLCQHYCRNAVAICCHEMRFCHSNEGKVVFNIVVFVWKEKKIVEPTNQRTRSVLGLYLGRAIVAFLDRISLQV